MLVSDLVTIGNKLLLIRKRMGMPQAEVTGLSNRTYVDIKRRTVNMRIETAASCTSLLTKYRPRKHLLSPFSRRSCWPA